MATQRGTKGLTRVDVLILLATGLVLLALLPAVSQQMKSDASRTACEANLSAIGKAMLVYANDNDGVLPRSGGRNTQWYGMCPWYQKDRRSAFGLAPDGTGGIATISSNLYLLVKYMGLEPRQFVCPGDAGTTEFVLADVRDLPEGFKLTDAWDFGHEAYKHCSYAYHIPFGLYCLTTSNDPRMAVAADRNPWINSPAGKVKDFASFKPDIEPWNATPQAARKGNSLSHGQDGQNVLFLDGHVSFEERPYCGLDKDNVYTCSSDFTRHGDALGFQPVAGPAFAPMNRRDSLLVHDPAPLYSEVVSQQAPSVDSKDLQQTAVVATLDCPLPEHKNAIWCSTFQIAWDRFRLDVIGEPLQVVGAEDLASRLNHGLFPMGDMEAKSWYAAAGFVSKGITKQIQKEMSRRFPSEPVPVFDQRYRTLEDGVLAYAYLNVDVGFTHPYYTLPVAFNFEDSNGTRAGVTAFCAQNEIRAANHQQIRDQVEVLYDDTSESAKTAEFAVDLCRHTQPYQVILARIPRANTLGETARTLRDKIAAFKDDPDYQALRKLRANDTLVVPDVLYKLTHHFDELLNKPFANARWRLYFFFEAMQKIDFTLSRTGVILRSEAGLGGTSAVKRNIQEPRRLHFDKPFLICVTKRDADASPFFLMWVDNAELMKRY